MFCLEQSRPDERWVVATILSDDVTDLMSATCGRNSSQDSAKWAHVLVSPWWEKLPPIITAKLSTRTSEWSVCNSQTSNLQIGSFVNNAKKDN